MIAMVHPSCDIRHAERIHFGEDVRVMADTWLDIACDNPHPGYMMEIGRGTTVGARCVISAANSIKIGEDVLIAFGVFISDTSHEYRDIHKPVIKQGITTHTDSIIIGDGSWIGTNVVINGNVRIGKHCVIGANSFVKKSIPDYCVAVGSPAKVIKAYDFNKERWVKV